MVDEVSARLRRLLPATIGAAVIAAVALTPSAIGIVSGLPQTPQPGWAVRIDYGDTPSCTGTMISLRWAVTAAHCFGGPENNPSVTFANVAGKRVGVDAIYLYPNWQPPYPDIALIHLATPVSGVSTLPLATNDDMALFAGKTVSVFGYGQSGPWTCSGGSCHATGSMTSIINKSPDGSWKLASCPSGSGGLHYCFEFLGNTAGLIGAGDSGGPWVGWRNGGWHILGVVSGYLKRVSLWNAATSPASVPVAAWINKTLTLPEADRLSPTHGSASGGYELDIYGGGFDPAPTSVTVGGTAVGVITISSTHLLLQVPPGPPNGGPAAVVVNMPGKSSNPLTFTYDAAPIHGFRVVNADVGVYWRATPNWNDAIRNPGYGVYTGDTVQLNCWVRGGTVPPYYNNPLWYQATVVSGRGKGSGLVNDHFLETGTNVPNIIVPGVPPCGSGPPPGPPMISNFDDCPNNYTSPISADPDTGADRVCSLDFGTELQPTDGIACSATLSNGSGLTASLAMTDSTGVQVSTGTFVLSGSPRSIFVRQTYLSSPWFGEAPFGTYTCDLSLGDQHVTRSFIDTSPPQTRAETTGGLAHTWTDYKNAGGTAGPTIGPNVTVGIECRTTGWMAPNGNNWWYRIGDNPWNGNYYVSADAFYNNGATSGSLKGTPFVDPAVPECRTASGS